MTEVWLAFGQGEEFDEDFGGWSSGLEADKILGVFADKRDAMKACTPDVVLFFEDRNAPKNIERWVHGNTRIEKWSVK